MPPIVNDSQSAQDVLTGPGTCGTAAPLGGFQDRCGFGPRIPLLLISPYARANFVSHARTAQTALIRFAETNWHLGSIGGGSLDVTSGSIEPMFNFASPSAGKLILDPSTGEPVASGASAG
jgi:phospholipase C